MFLNCACAGGGKVSFRKIYTDQTDVTCTLTINFCCNEIPRISPYDDAMRGRMYIIPFTSKFVYDEKEVNQEKGIFLVDAKFENEEWKQKFSIQYLHILRRYLLKFLR